MRYTKLKSFTLSEMLVVMIITAIVVGMAFSVLSLVQKQIRNIQKNFDRTTVMSLFEQCLWQDLNGYNSVVFQNEGITMTSDIDTMQYSFKESFVLRNKDTIHVKVKLEKAYYEGAEVTSGVIDAVSFLATELQDYKIFVSSQPDPTQKMNQDGI